MVDFLQSFIHPGFLKICSEVSSEVVELAGQFPRNSISSDGIASIFQFQLANFLYYVNLAGLRFLCLIHFFSCLLHFFWSLTFFSCLLHFFWSLTFFSCLLHFFSCLLHFFGLLHFFCLCKSVPGKI